jgi:class 3 adenylate cyclase/tetratricopeptide (TPR) repeat protein
VGAGIGGEVRKTVTVLFCDVTGSTSLGEQLDPESLRSVMSRFFEAMRTVLERHGGTVEKFIGDAVMAVFGIPTVHEDDALRAVRAAAEMREALASLNKELERDRGVTIAARIGVNTGAVVAGDPDARQSLVTGDAVNVAARLEQSAAPGEILIGVSTMDLVRDAVVAEPVEPLTVKGKTGTIDAFRLEEVGEDPLGVARRLDAPMVGRISEVGTLRACFERASRERTCVLATIVGVPGVGKSRLVREFVDGLPEPSVVVRGRCLSYGDGITYWPIVEILTAVAGIVDTDGPGEIRAKIDGLLEGSPEGAIAAERLAEFLGLAGAAATPEETHWAIRKLFEALASDRPLVAVFEDIHWAEPGLLDLIEHVTDWTLDAPILLVCPARPDLLDARPDWGGGHTSTKLFLDPLSADESDTLIAGLLGRDGAPTPVAARVMEAAEGNPLFVEQMVAMLIDEGHLVREGDDWVVTGDLSDIQVPPTIAGLLQARLDGLPLGEQRVIERGAVEGRTFHWGSVTELSTELDPSEVGRHLMALRRRGLIGPEQALFGGSEAFRFRHALIRDASYERIPKRTRAELHEGHARWLERTAGDRVAEFEDVLAYHLEQAYRLRADLGPVGEDGRELAARAGRLLAAGGRRAVDRGDVAAAMNLLGRAVALMDEQDPALPDLLVRLGRVAIEAGELELGGTTLDRAESASAAVGDEAAGLRARLARIELFLTLSPEGVIDRIDLETREAIPALERLGDDEGLARAYRALAEIGLLRLRARDCETSLQRAAFHAERAGDRSALADTLLWLAIVPYLGSARPEEMIRRCDEVRARAPGDRTVEAFAAFVEGIANAMLGRSEEGRELHRRAREIVRDLGMQLTIGGSAVFVGGLETIAGDFTAAERAYRAGYDVLSAIGEKGFLSTIAGELANTLVELGRSDEAIELADVSRETGASEDLITQVLWREARARVLARRERLEEAIQLAEEAVEMMTGSDAADSMAAALSALSEVCELAGRRDDARRALREALELLERRGNQPVADRTRTNLERLEGATPV